MLAYAFQELRHNNYEDISKESFDNIQNLFAEILIHGISCQIKQGLYKDYVVKEESLPRLKGKICIHATIHNIIHQRKEIACQYDELSINNIYNQVIKTAASILIRDNSVTKQRRAELKSLMRFFTDIDIVDPNTIPWNRFQFQRNNRSYQMLINICYFLFKEALPTTEAGKYRMQVFSDKNMEKLFEHFVLEYYRKEFKGTLSANAPHIKWALDEKEGYYGTEYLPQMKSDIMLKHGENTLIIDAKYYGYGRTFQKHHEKQTIHNANLYQIMAYVNNEDKYNSGRVSGMLLYARTLEEIAPDMCFSVKGNNYLVKTIDLNLEFDQIREQLNGFVYNAFPGITPQELNNQI